LPPVKTTTYTVYLSRKDLNGSHIKTLIIGMVVLKLLSHFDILRHAMDHHCQNPSYCQNSKNGCNLLCTCGKYWARINTISSVLKVTTLPTELKEISTRSTNRGYLNLLWYLNDQAINLISLDNLPSNSSLVQRISCYTWVPGLMKCPTSCRPEKHFRFRIPHLPPL
jgi:hypothetical protein